MNARAKKIGIHGGFPKKQVSVHIEYSRDIRGVFTGYSYVSVMCRLCIGYASVMYRNIMRAMGALIQISCKGHSKNLNYSL